MRGGPPPARRGGSVCTHTGRAAGERGPFKGQQLTESEEYLAEIIFKALTPLKLSGQADYSRAFLCKG